MAKPILILNCGSSSIKYQMIDAETEKIEAKGLVERIGTGTPGHIKHQVGGQSFEVNPDLPDHKHALRELVQMFNGHGPDLSNCLAVGHRAVHGGTKLVETTVVDDQVIDIMQDLSGLAPLHNPPVVQGIQAAREVLPNVPHVTVVDTAFFSDLPDEASRYAIDPKLAEKYEIRRYGFHGTSHKFISEQVPGLIGKPADEVKQIVCHLGNGASVSAVDAGKPIDTSMGLTPLAGLVMGTRCGDIDPGTVFYLMREANMSADEVDNLLNKRSGMLGLSGYVDMRDVEDQYHLGDTAAKRAVGVYVHRLVSYIGAYFALLGGLDAITFTAGVGENSPFIRALTCGRLSGLGVDLDLTANEVRSPEARIISKPDSKVRVLVVPTNEELAMAREVVGVLGIV